MELARDAYLCLEQPGRRSSTWLMNVTCGCRAALNTLALRRRHNRTRDAEDRLLRTELADVLNTTAERLPWSAAILEVPTQQWRRGLNKVMGAGRKLPFFDSQLQISDLGYHGY